jgi:hypothetical protein
MYKNNLRSRPSKEPAQGAVKQTWGKTRAVNLLSWIAVAILMASAALPAEASPAVPSSSAVTFIATSDAQVKEAQPGTNYGKTTYLQVDGGSGSRVESYMLFNVSGLSGSVSSAKLRVYDTTNGSSNGPMVYGTGTSWTETGITWKKRPARTTSGLGNVGSVGTNVWVEYDVSSYVTTNGAYSFVLVADSKDGLTFSSRQGSQPPQLVVTIETSSAATPTATPQPSSGTGSVVLVGAGDISSCSNNNDEATAKLLDGISGTVFAAGDDAYPDGTSAQFTDCYGPTWGRHKSRTKPVPGNHEYHTSGASGYFDYFNNIPSYYAYDLGSWRIYALNSEIDVSATSAQIKWLQSDLAANPRQCVLAYWHKPRWSSGSSHGSSSSMQTFWQVLYNAGAEVILNGHEHNYERFKEMNASGAAASPGLREFVVGTGGAGHYGFGTALSTSEVRNSSTYGVLQLTLNSTSYSWKFVPVAGQTFTDSGTTNCH